LSPKVSQGIKKAGRFQAGPMYDKTKSIGAGQQGANGGSGYGTGYGNGYNVNPGSQQQS